MESIHCSVKILWDDEASVWIAANEDVKGTNLMIRFVPFEFLCWPRAISIRIVFISCKSRIKPYAGGGRLSIRIVLDP